MDTIGRGPWSAILVGARFRNTTHPQQWHSEPRCVTIMRPTWQRGQVGADVGGGRIGYSFIAVTIRGRFLGMSDSGWQAAER
jgi:hypothetical protein